MLNLFIGFVGGVLAMALVFGVILFSDLVLDKLS